MLETVSQNMYVDVGGKWHPNVIDFPLSPPIIKSNFPLPKSQVPTKKTYNFYLEEVFVWMLCFTSYTLHPRKKMHSIAPFSFFLDLIQPAVLHSFSSFLVDNFPLWHPSEQSILGLWSCDKVFDLTITWRLSYNDTGHVLVHVSLLCHDACCTMLCGLSCVMAPAVLPVLRQVYGRRLWSRPLTTLCCAAGVTWCRLSGSPAASPPAPSWNATRESRRATASRLPNRNSSLRWDVHTSVSDSCMIPMRIFFFSFAFFVLFDESPMTSAVQAPKNPNHHQCFDVAKSWWVLKI